jgi:hypothetical protein
LSVTQLEDIPYLNVSDEERRIRLEISRMIELAHFFHTTHTDTNYSFFSGLIHTNADEVEEYETLLYPRLLLMLSLPT